MIRPSHLLALFALSLVLYLKTSVVYLPDFLATGLCLYGIRDPRVRRFFKAPPLLAILLVALVNLPLGLLTELQKPYWSYHLIRILVYLGAAYYLGLTVPSADRRFSFWFAVGACVGSLGAIAAGFAPQLLPSWLDETRMSSYWSLDGPVRSTNVGLVFRTAGIYASYSEAGNVLAAACLLVIGQIYTCRRALSVTLYSLALALLASGLFLTAYRSAVIGAMVGVGGFVLLGIRRKNLARLVRSAVLLVVVLPAIWLLVDPLAQLERAHVDTVNRLSFFGDAFDLLFRGIRESSFDKTLSSFQLPSSATEWLVGNGLGSWAGGGVTSDIGYVQALWGVGFIGLATLVYFYFWMLTRALTIFRRTYAGLALASTMLVVAHLLLNIKGQYLIGIRAGDLVVSAFGILAGSLGLSKRDRLRRCSLVPGGLEAWPELPGQRPAMGRSAALRPDAEPVWRN